MSLSDEQVREMRIRTHAKEILNEMLIKYNAPTSKYGAVHGTMIETSILIAKHFEDSEVPCKALKEN
jgi:RIO-like serine/threonine protein kinase